MVIPAQFQLGLELTNIVNPISQAMSALGSLALIDAIKKSGSDFITETKLASLIGRHRIDPIIKFHFREMVAKSDQSVISRYVDIILESGSGPTVQEALKNPALFSMVIQLSGLAFAHEDESLTNTMVEAIEKILQESGGDVGIVPDYVSLLGTIQACQQQTAAFRWALLYEAAEERIHKALAGLDNSSDGRQISNYSLKTFPSSVRNRSLPVPVLQGMLMWLQSLQSFPEHRLLHVRCYTGISTVVVWAHHILGLSLTINIQGIRTCFGNAPYNLVVEESPCHNAGVSLMDPLDPQEPLFTLQNDEGRIGTNYDYRAEAYGYCTKYLQLADLSSHELYTGAQWVVSYSNKIGRIFRAGDSYYDVKMKTDFHAHVSSPFFPSEDRLVNAGRFLFAIDDLIIPRDHDFNIPRGDSSFHLGNPTCQGLGTSHWLTLVAIVTTFARIPKDDLVKCREMPLALALPVHPQELSNRDQVVGGGDYGHPKGFIDLLGSFEILSILLLGRRMYNQDYAKPAVLVSAWGWSIFLDSIDSVDPSDVPLDRLRVLRGVPSRRGLRRTRIIDGPRTPSMPTALQPLSNSQMRIHLGPGVSTAEKSVILVGHHSDAFHVTQTFTCHLSGVGIVTYGYGFRQMTEWSVGSRRIAPCQCPKPVHEHSTSQLKHITPSAHKISVIDKLFEEKDGLVRRAARPSPTNSFSQSSDLERVFASQDRRRHFVYVSDSPAARWLQLEILYSNRKPRDRGSGATEYQVALGGRDTCVDCAVRNICFIRNHKTMPPYTVYLL